MSNTAEFTDSKARVWRLEFNIPICRRLKSEVGFDIGDLQEGKALIQMVMDPMKFAQVLWLLCESQADRDKVTEEQFGQSLNGDALDDAFVALNGAVVNFTPSHLRAAAMKVVAATDQAMQASGKAMVRAIESQADQITEVIERETKKAIDESLSGST